MKRLDPEIPDEVLAPYRARAKDKAELRRWLRDEATPPELLLQFRDWIVGQAVRMYKGHQAGGNAQCGHFRKNPAHYLSLQDWIAAAEDGILRAFEKFDPSVGSSMDGYLMSGVVWKLKTKRNDMLSAAAVHAPLSWQEAGISAELFSKGFAEISYVDTSLEEEEWAAWVEGVAADCASPEDADLFVRWLRGEAYLRDAAEVLGISQQAVSLRFRKYLRGAREWLREAVA